MHEVSLSLQLAAAVSRAARGRPVRVVYVAIGALRQVVPEALEHAWVFTVRGTPLGAAELDLDLLPAVLTCDECGSDTTLGPELGFGCAACGSAATRVISGEQFTLTAIDIDIEKGTCDGTFSPT